MLGRAPAVTSPQKAVSASELMVFEAKLSPTSVAEVVATRTAAPSTSPVPLFKNVLDAIVFPA